MFGLFKEKSGFSVDRALAICGFALGNDEYEAFRADKALFEDFSLELAAELQSTSDLSEKSDQIRYLRSRLIEAARMNAVGYMFLMAEPTERAAMVDEIWSDAEISSEDADHSAKAMILQQQAKFSCLQLVLNDLNRPVKDDWWSGYSMLWLGGADQEVIAAAGDSILAGENMAGFERAIDSANAAVRAKRDARKNT